MTQLNEFLSNHPFLTLALGLVLIAIIVNELVLLKRGGKRLNPSDAVRLINDKGALVVDLRSVADFKRGHILDSVNVPYAKLTDKQDKLGKKKDRPLVLCCALGSVSGQAAPRLREMGFSEVYPMAGGLNAWQNAGLPVTTK